MPLIKNNAPHFRGLPATHGKRGAHKEHVLFPGPNKVGDAEWEEAKKLPLIKALLADGILEEVKAKGSKPASTLEQLKEVDAIKLVKETTDPELLAGWREKASPAVLKALEVRLDELKAAAKTGAK